LTSAIGAGAASDPGRAGGGGGSVGISVPTTRAGHIGRPARGQAVACARAGSAAAARPSIAPTLTAPARRQQVSRSGERTEGLRTATTTSPNTQ
jgi:hypothetical protein